jgi:hypothetical protein
MKVSDALDSMTFSSINKANELIKGSKRRAKLYRQLGNSLIQLADTMDAERTRDLCE